MLSDQIRETPLIGGVYICGKHYLDDSFSR